MVLKYLVIISFLGIINFDIESMIEVVWLFMEIFIILKNDKIRNSLRIEIFVFLECWVISKYSFKGILC